MAGTPPLSRIGVPPPWMRQYRRDWMLPDLLATLTLLAIAVPEQLATSRLAGMPPITGFYAFIAGGVCFALIGANRWLSVGADSTIAPLFAVGIAGLAASGSTRYLELVAVLAVAVGVLVMAVGLLRLGWVAEFLSTPIITGFLAGVAVIIVVHELPDLLGTPPPTGSVVHRLAFTAAHVGQLTPWALGPGVGVLVLLFAGEAVDRRLPAGLMGLVGSAALIAAAGAAHRASLVGAVQPQPPTFRPTGLAWSDVGRVMPLAAVVALVVVTQSAATSRAFSGNGSPAGSMSRDFVGVGAGSVLAGLVGAFPVDASPPRTAAVVEAGGRTQAVSLGAAAIMAALIPAADLLRYVPLSALAAILIFVATRMFHARDLVAIGRFSRFELLLAAVAALTVAFVGVQEGIGVAVALAILDRARRDARPQLHVLGRVPGTTSFAPISSAERAEQVPGVLVVLFSTPLWYANADHFRLEMEAAEARTIGPAHAVVLDAIGMSDIDYTGLKALEHVLDGLDRRHVVFAVARAGAKVRAELARAGMVGRIGPHRFYGTVGEAVTAVVEETPGSTTAAPAAVTIDPVAGLRRGRRSGR